MKAVIITTNGGFAVTELEGYEAMQDVVGGLIEPVRFDGFDAWVNEEGLLIPLPPNEPAHFVLREMALTSGVTEFRWMPQGDVFLTGGVDDEGNTLDVPEEVITKARTLCKAIRPNPYG